MADRLEAPLITKTERWGHGTIFLYRELLFEQQGRCLVCQIEEWKIKRPLQIHRIVNGKLGGRYTKENCVLVCTNCHRKCEGLSRDQLNALRIAEMWKEAV